MTPKVKNEAMQEVSEIYTIEGNYKGIGKYWGENGAYCSINTFVAPRLEIDEKLRNAQLIFAAGGGSVYGIIELQGQSDNVTKVIMHTWGDIPLSCIDESNDFLKRNFKVLSIVN